MDVATLSDIIKEVSERTGFPIDVVKANVDVMLRILVNDMQSPEINKVSLPFLGRMVVPAKSLERYLGSYGGMINEEKLNKLEKKLENIKKEIEDKSASPQLLKVMKNTPIEMRRKYKGKFGSNNYRKNEEYQNKLSDKLNARKRD